MNEPQHLDATQAPRLSLWFFYHRYNRQGRRLFMAGWLLLILCVGLLLVADTWPAAWSVDVTADSLSENEDVVLETVTHRYRPINVVAKASYSFSTYVAGLLMPPAWAVWFLFVALAAGWSLALAASSRATGFVQYAIYFAFILFLYTTGIHELIFNHSSPYLALLPAAVFIGPAYLFNGQSVRLSLFWQALLFLGLFLVMGIVLFVMKGMVGIHTLATFGQPVLLVIALLFIVLCSKDLAALLVYFGTNAKDKSKRLPLNRLMNAGALLVLVQLPVLLGLVGVLPLSWAFYSPLLLLAIAAIATPFTTQNAYHQLEDLITHNLAYTLLILAAGILGIATLAYDIVAGELMLRLVIHRLVAITFAATTLGYLLYVLANYMPLLVQRVTLYYALMKPIRVRFVAVWFMTLFFVVMYEGFNGWRAYRTWHLVRINQRADNALIEGKVADGTVEYKGLAMPGDLGSLSLYEEALARVPDCPKANLNAAALRIGQMRAVMPGDEANQVILHYERASLGHIFPYNAINYGRFMAQIGYGKRARPMLKAFLEKNPDDRVSANLAALYYYDQDPDSAILALKEGIKTNPGNALLYANLATVYHKWDRKEYALKFADAAYDLADGNPTVQQNYAFMSLRYQTDLTDMPEPDTTGLAHVPYNALLNRAMAQYRLGKLTEANATLDGLINTLSERQLALPEAYLMKLAVAARTDSVKSVQSRYQYVHQAHPELRAMASHIMGVYSYRNDALYAARQYFGLAADEGQPADSLLAALTTIDLGLHEQGYEQLQKLSVSKYSYGDVIRHEMAMLDSVYGTPSFFLQWNFEDMRVDEAMRMAHYAGIKGKLHIAALAYEIVLKNQPGAVEPYVEMARLYADQKDYATAHQQLDAGEKKAKDKQPLRHMRARLWLMEGKLGKATEVLAALNQNDAEVLRLRGEVAMARKQYKIAARWLQQSLDKQPLLATRLLLGRCYTAQGLTQAAYNAWGPAILLESYDPDLQREYAWVAWGLGFEKEAKESMEKAIEMAQELGRKTDDLLADQRKLQADIEATNYKPLE